MEIIINGIKTTVLKVLKNNSKKLELLSNETINFFEGEGFYIKDGDKFIYVNFNCQYTDATREDGNLLYSFDIVTYTEL
jgi:hypothetical protein